MAIAIPPSASDTALDPLGGLPVQRRQLLLLGLILLLAALDGFDSLAMALVAPALSLEWNLGKAVLGMLLSSGLVGMALGSLLLAPIADRFGRRPMVIIGLVVMTLGSLIAAFAPNVSIMAGGRVVTGIGIGVMIPMTTLCAAEFANARRRPLAVAAVATVGFSLGGVLGSLLASVLLQTVGWHWVFLSGAIGGAVLLAPIALLLPETPAFLVARQGPGALQRVNRVLLGFGHPPLEALPQAQQQRRRQSYRALFAPGMAAKTVKLIAINLLVATTTYYIVSWLPQQIADAGFSPSTGSFVSATSHAFGLVGGLLMGALAARFAPTRLAGCMMIGCAAALAVLGLAPPMLAILMTAACAYAFFGVATTGLFYGILAVSFPSLNRASGIGLVMGIGRISSAVGPALAGWMFAEGLSRGTVSTIFACGPLLAAALIWNLPKASSRHEG